jgi:predicted nucleic acid-binding protein
MLVVDTSVWIDYFNGVENSQTDFLHLALENTPILIGDLILAEVLQGFRRDPDFEKVRRTLGKFMQASMVSPALAVQSARNYRLLRQKGITIRKTIDSLIATTTVTLTDMRNIWDCVLFIHKSTAKISLARRSVC